MPITALKTAFSPEDTAAMTAAFEESLKRLKVADQEAPIATSVAKESCVKGKTGWRSVTSHFRAQIPDGIRVQARACAQSSNRSCHPTARLRKPVGRAGAPMTVSRGRD